MCSIAFLCPFGCLIGPLFGVRALVEIRANPGMGGRRLALAGIAIGLAGTIFWAVAAAWWNANARQPMLQGPSEALAIGLAGDVAGFRSWFFDPDGTLDDVEAAAFLANLQGRYGRFIMAAQDPDGRAGGDALRPIIPYVLRFEAGDVRAAARFVTFSEHARGPVMKFAWIAVYEEYDSDLVYPSERAAETVPPREEEDADDG